MIAVVSVPHTGTRFTQKILGTKAFCHWGDGRIPLWMNEGYRIVVPSRSTEAVLQTHLERGTLGEGEVLRQLVAIYTWASRHPLVHVFRVDPPNYQRDGEIEALRTFTGRDDLTTDWQKVGTKAHLRSPSPVGV